MDIRIFKFSPFQLVIFSLIGGITFGVLVGKPAGKVELDAMLYTAESASAWTLIFPRYSVVIPQGLEYKAPLSLAPPNRQPEFMGFINLWLEVAKTKGLINRLETYWIYGRTEKEDGK